MRVMGDYDYSLLCIIQIHVHLKMVVSLAIARGAAGTFKRAVNHESTILKEDSVQVAYAVVHRPGKLVRVKEQTCERRQKAEIAWNSSRKLVAVCLECSQVHREGGRVARKQYIQRTV